MLVNTCFGTRDLEQAGRFYDAVMGAARPCPHRRKRTVDLLRQPGPGAGFAVTLPFDGKPASNGNGTMATVGVAGPRTGRCHARRRAGQWRQLRRRSGRAR